MMVTYNRLDLTRQTIDRLYKSTKVPFELVVVDNGSTDGTVEYLASLQADLAKTAAIHPICFSENKGIAYGRNTALQFAARGNCEWYVTIDNDVLLPDNWLEDCINILSKNKNYASIGVNFEEVDYPVITKNDCTFQNKPKGNLGTACMVFNRSLHKLLGYFSMEYSSFYGLEDSNFGMRVRVAGFKLGYIKENGIHLGVGEHDKGEYREFKTKEHNKYLDKFNADCAAYARKQKSLFIPFP